MTRLPVSPLLPASAAQLTEDVSLAFAQQIRQAVIPTSLQTPSVCTSYVHQPGEGPPLVLLHGFDSSIFEFRRLLPQLRGLNTWAVDLFGFGFNERSPAWPVTPATIRLHLYNCWQHWWREPVVLVGASMGGAAALDFSLAYPEAVAALVLLDSAGTSPGPWIGKYLVSPLDRWAVEFLRRPNVRRDISLWAYHRPEVFVTPDAEACASLHLEMPHWDEALRSFTRSGGYPSLRHRLGEVQQPTLIVWGRQDRILGTRSATTFQRLLPNARLSWIEDCGHVPHLEQPKSVGMAIYQFLTIKR
jgi:pimeloyl-ACP methyl ester carboxylesterase